MNGTQVRCFAFHYHERLEHTEAISRNSVSCQKNVSLWEHSYGSIMWAPLNEVAFFRLENTIDLCQTFDSIIGGRPLVLCKSIRRTQHLPSPNTSLFDHGHFQRQQQHVLRSVVCFYIVTGKLIVANDSIIKGHWHKRHFLLRKIHQ